MAVNVKLLRKTLEHIKVHEDGWEQGDWRCQAGMCFAGWAAQLAGGQWLNKHATNRYSDTYLLAKQVDGEDIFEHMDFKVVQASNRAQRVLGLSWDQRHELFKSSNELEDLERIVSRIEAEEATSA